MDKLSRSTLWSLERYAVERPAFRARVMAHKRSRQVALGAHATLFFEDCLTMRYQVQEMLRAERIFEADEIQGELDAYNPLIPDGRNWKATLMFEYADVDERHRALARMVGIEHRVWVRVAGFEPVFGMANEDMERSNEEKTAAVHFLSFELPPPPSPHSAPRQPSRWALTIRRCPVRWWWRPRFAPSWPRISIKRHHHAAAQLAALPEA